MFDLLVSVTLFVGRFDMRMMQVNMMLLILSKYILLERSSYCNNLRDAAIFIFVMILEGSRLKMFLLLVKTLHMLMKWQVYNVYVVLIIKDNMLDK